MARPSQLFVITNAFKQIVNLRFDAFGTSVLMPAVFIHRAEAEAVLAQVEALYPTKFALSFIDGAVVAQAKFCDAG